MIEPEQFFQLAPSDQAAELFALRFQRTKRNRRFLLKLVGHAPHLSPEVVAALLELLYDHRLAAAVPFVREQLLSSDPNIRFFACEALGWLGEPRDVRLLKPLAFDEAIAHPFEEPVSVAANAAIARLSERVSQDG